MLAQCVSDVAALTACVYMCVRKYRYDYTPFFVVFGGVTSLPEGRSGLPVRSLTS